MPIDYFKPIDSLRKVKNSALLNPSDLSDQTDQVAKGGPQGTGTLTQSPDPDLTENTFLTRMGDELRGRQFNATRLGEGAESKALAGLQGYYSNELDKNPVEMQSGFNRDTLAKTHLSDLAGFKSPQESAKWSRGLEEQKVGSPLAVAKVGAQGDIDRQRIASQGLENVASIQNRPREAGMDLFRGLISGGGAGQDSNKRGVRSLSIPDVGSLSLQTPTKESRIPANLLTQVNKARAAFNTANTGLGWNAASAKKNLDAAIATALSQHPASGSVKEMATAIAKDPTLSKMTFDQILQHPELVQTDDLSPDEKDDLLDILSITRGF